MKEFIYLGFFMLSLFVTTMVSAIVGGFFIHVWGVSGLAGAGIMLLCMAMLWPMAGFCVKCLGNYLWYGNISHE